MNEVNCRKRSLVTSGGVLVVSAVIATMVCSVLGTFTASPAYERAIRLFTEKCQSILPRSSDAGNLIAVTLDPRSGLPKAKGIWIETTLGSWPHHQPQPETGVVFAVLASALYAIVVAIAYFVQPHAQVRSHHRLFKRLPLSIVAHLIYFVCVPLLFIIRETISYAWISLAIPGSAFAWVQPRMAFVSATIVVIFIAWSVYISILRSLVRSSSLHVDASTSADQECCWQCGYACGEIAPCPECGVRTPLSSGDFYMTAIGRALARSPARRRLRFVLWLSAGVLLFMLPLIVGSVQVLLGRLA